MSKNSTPKTPKVPPRSTIRRGVPITSQSKELIYNLYDYWKVRNKFRTNRINVAQKVARALKLSDKTVQRIVTEHKRMGGEGATFSSPKKKWKKSYKKINVDEFDTGVIRKSIHDYHIIKRELPTVSKLHKQLKEEINFEGGTSTLYRLIKSLGFKWRKTEANKKILMEKIDIVTKRVDYLRQLAQYRMEGRPIIFTDEAYVHSAHTASMSSSDSSNVTFKTPVAKGPRFVIVHAGGEGGFVPNALLIFKSHSTGDSLNDIEHEIYENWLKTKLIPNLPPYSVLVLDSGPYHDTKIDPMPNGNSRKTEMVEWLMKNNVNCEIRMLKTDLYKLIVANKPRLKSYKIDAMLAERGHSVLRLPPHHPELNPIGNIWSLIRGHVASMTSCVTLESVQKLVGEKIQEITVDVWNKTCKHVEEVERKYTNNDYILDIILDDSFVNDVGNSSSDERSSDEWSSDNSSDGDD